MGPDLLAVTPAHSELRGQLPQTPRSRLIGFQHLHTQIIRIRLCHRLVFAKIAKPTMTALPFPAYNYCDSALAGCKFGCNLLRDQRLDRFSDLDIIEVGQSDAALHAVGNLTGIILEALQ